MRLLEINKRHRHGVMGISLLKWITLLSLWKSLVNNVVCGFHHLMGINQTLSQCRAAALTPPRAFPLITQLEFKRKLATKATDLDVYSRKWSLSES